MKGVRRTPVGAQGALEVLILEVRDLSAGLVNVGRAGALVLLGMVSFEESRRVQIRSYLVEIAE